MIRIRPPRCVYCGETKPRTIVAGGLAHKRCIPAEGRSGQKAGRVVKGQTMIPGTEPKRDKQIHALAEKYVVLRDARMEVGREEVEAKGKLIGAMQAKELTVYRYGELSVELDTKDVVKVKIAKDDPEE